SRPTIGSRTSSFGSILPVPSSYNQQFANIRNPLDLNNNSNNNNNNNNNNILRSEYGDKANGNFMNRGSNNKYNNYGSGNYTSSISSSLDITNLAHHQLTQQQQQQQQYNPNA